MNRFFITLVVVSVIAGCGRCVGPGECDPDIPYPQPGACPLDGKLEGEIGGPCKDTTYNFCETGSWCIQGTCLPCGADNQVCCSGTTCNGGVTCDFKEEVNMCTASCGQPGMPCCPPNDCADGSGAICADGKTCTPSNTPQCYGNVKYYVGTIDIASRCAGPVFPISANSWDDAITCTHGTLEQLGLTNTLEPLSPAPAPDPGKEHLFCKTSVGDPTGTTVTVNAYSDADAQACANYTNCAIDHDDTCQVTPGACQ